jgi:hypothetical protein
MACGLDRTSTSTVSSSDNPKISLINQWLTSEATDGVPMGYGWVSLGLPMKRADVGPIGCPMGSHG